MADLGEFADAQFDIERERRKAQAAAAALKRAYDEIDRLNSRVDLLTAVDDVTVRGSTEWKRPAKKTGGKAGIANLILSDLHLDEVVNPAEVNGVNAYNRQIAEKRLRRTFERFVVIAQDYISGINYEGAVVPLLGDLFSGNIHEELRATNEGSIIESIDHWIDPMLAGLRMVADEFGKVHVPCIVGNHGRNTYKPIHKGAVRDNFDWLFCRQLARALAGDKRVTFDIPDSTWTQMAQYGTVFHYEHGDRGFSGGGGVAGLFSPLMRGDMKLRKRQAAIRKPYDILVIGHFHQYLPVPSYGLICNGSMKGYDDYAASLKFGYEPPQQAFFVTTPTHGVTFDAPIRGADRKAEGW